MSNKRIKKIDNQILEEEVGRGIFGVVQKARHKLTGIVQAVKQINTEDNERKDKRFHNRLGIETFCLKIVSPHICSLINYYKSKNNYYLVMEFCKYNLSHVIDGFRGNIEMTREFALQFFIGQVKIFENKYIHRDIKPANVLFTEQFPDDLNFTLKIGDFGLAFNTQECLEMSQAGTPMYQAPEMLLLENSINPCHKVDIFSIGVLLYQIQQGHHPQGSPVNRRQLYDTIKSEKNIFGHCKDPDFISLLKGCLEFNPEKRFSIHECMQCKFINKHPKYFSKKQEDEVMQINRIGGLQNQNIFVSTIEDVQDDSQTEENENANVNINELSISKIDLKDNTKINIDNQSDIFLNNATDNSELNEQENNINQNNTNENNTLYNSCLNVEDKQVQQQKKDRISQDHLEVEGEVIINYNEQSDSNQDLHESVANSILNYQEFNNESIKTQLIDIIEELEMVQSILDISLVELTKSIYTRSFIVVRVVIELLRDINQKQKDIFDIQEIDDKEKYRNFPSVQNLFENVSKISSKFAKMMMESVNLQNELKNQFLSENQAYETKVSELKDQIKETNLIVKGQLKEFLSYLEKQGSLDSKSKKDTDLIKIKNKIVNWLKQIRSRSLIENYTNDLERLDEIIKIYNI